MHLKEIFEHYQPQPLGDYKRYAVLMPLIEVEGKINLLYEIRSQMVSQPGDAAFPGGRVEAGETPQQTAIRETAEELNLSPENIRLYGEMDFIISERNGFISVFVGELIDVDIHAILPNEEVAEIFFVPLSILLEAEPDLYYGKLKLERPADFPIHLIPGKENYHLYHGYHPIPIYQIQDRCVWGLTARMTNRFIEILKEAANER